MRELKLNSREHKKFLKVMDEKLSEKDMSYEDLADEIGVALHSIYNFRTDTTRNPSRYLAGKICTYLNIKPKDYRVKTSFFS